MKGGQEINIRSVEKKTQRHGKLYDFDNNVQLTSSYLN